jgi:hypothetical protein
MTYGSLFKGCQLPKEGGHLAPFGDLCGAPPPPAPPPEDGDRACLVTNLYSQCVEDLRRRRGVLNEVVSRMPRRRLAGASALPR